jgi:hypothetical protein
MKYSIFLDLHPSLRAVDSRTGEIYNWSFDGIEPKYEPMGNRISPPQIPTKVVAALRAAAVAWKMSEQLSESKSGV